jgi:hypothetical protein
VLVAFDLITSSHLLSADVVAAIDPRDPDRELPLYPPAVSLPAATERSVRVLRVVVDSHRRDEQVRYLRDWFAAARPTRVATRPTWTTLLGSADLEAG